MNTKGARLVSAFIFSSSPKPPTSYANATVNNDRDEKNRVVLRAAYEFQLSVRIDEIQQTLNFDCFEYNPRALNKDNENLRKKHIKDFDDCFTGMLFERGFGGGEKFDSEDDGDEDDEDDEEEYGSGIFGEEKNGTANSLNSSTKPWFSTTPPFKPTGVTIPISGGLSLIPTLQALSTSKAVAVAIGATPAELEEKGFPPLAVIAIAVAAAEKSANDEKKAAKLTVDGVHALLVGLGLTQAQAERANDCLKRGILVGHIKIDAETTLDDVLLEGQCLACSKPIVCTIQNALYQPCYAGTDYEDGSQGGAVICESCEVGAYITDLCASDPSFDSGKFHNHCCECPDFGVCIKDYRNAHCSNCGTHWFCGMSGFPCPDCKGGTVKSVKSMAFPDAVVFSGRLPGAEEVVAKM